MNWLMVEILQGFRKLVCLNLQGTPATDILEGTALAWVESMTYNRDWDRLRDTARIREAFVIVGATRDYWPSPRAFMAAIPPIEQRALPKPKPATPEVAEAALAEIGELLHVEHSEKPPEEVSLSAADVMGARARRMSTLEQELRDLYGKRDGKTMAAGPDA